MAVTVTHAHVSTVPDNPAKDVSSGEWNDPHVVEGAVEGSGIAKLTVAAVAPSTPAVGDVWIDTSS